MLKGQKVTAVDYSAALIGGAIRFAERQEMAKEKPAGEWAKEFKAFLRTYKCEVRPK